MKWSDQWITTAHEIVEKEYTKNYAGRFNASQPDDDMVAHETSDDEEDEGDGTNYDGDEDDGEGDAFLGEPNRPPSDTASATSGNSDFDEVM